MIFRRIYFAIVSLAAVAAQAIILAPLFAYERIAAPAASLFWRGLDLLLGLFTPIDDGRRLHFAEPTPAYRDGEPLESSLLNSLRHEAGMRPLRC